VQPQTPTTAHVANNLNRMLFMVSFLLCHCRSRPRHLERCHLLYWPVFSFWVGFAGELRRGMGDPLDHVLAFLYLGVCRWRCRRKLGFSAISSSRANHWFWYIVSRAIRKASMSLIPGSSVIS
jgi:hypothetical protein